MPITVPLAPLPGNSGFYLLIERAAGPVVAREPRHDDTAGNTATVLHEGETVYVRSMAAQLISGSNPRGQLLQALEQDQFILFAQKIMPLAPGISEPRCVEILLRLQEEEQQMLPPGGFFPVAEHYGLMGEIDRWVVRNLLKWCAARQRDHRNWRMPLCCVNLSSAGLCDAGFPLYVQSELERYGVPGNRLCFEIAELDVINHSRDVQALMAMLKPRGCRFTADSFGSVRVSFAPFKHLSFDFLKIAGIIIQNILRERSDFAKTVAIVMACRKMGIRSIAEFVESADVLTKLRKIGVDYVQGFGIGKPASLAQLS